MRAEMQFLVVWADGTPEAPVDGQRAPGAMPLYRARHLLMARMRQEPTQWVTDRLTAEQRRATFHRFQLASIGELLDGLVVQLGPCFVGIIPEGMRVVEAGRPASAAPPSSAAQQLAARAAAAGREAVGA